MSIPRLIKTDEARGRHRHFDFVSFLPLSHFSRTATPILVSTISKSDFIFSHFSPLARERQQKKERRVNEKKRKKKKKRKCGGNFSSFEMPVVLFLSLFLSSHFHISFGPHYLFFLLSSSSSSLSKTFPTPSPFLSSSPSSSSSSFPSFS